ncbi:MAG: hypothetical protein JW908_08185 [Anaerolineales bacterium]|nr:hypothetical protein [Anaerolineales bacterium]
MYKNCQASEEPNVTQTDELKQETIILLRRGDLCPQCGQGRMDYDGLLNLSCPQCGYTNTTGGSFT